MATLIPDNVAHFTCTPASGGPEYYEWQITDGWHFFDIQVAPGPDFHIPHWGMDREFAVQARGVREETPGPWSPISELYVIQPVPEADPSWAFLFLVTGWLLLAIRAVWRNR